MPSAIRADRCHDPYGAIPTRNGGNNCASTSPNCARLSKPPRLPGHGSSLRQRRCCRPRPAPLLARIQVRGTLSCSPTLAADAGPSRNIRTSPSRTSRRRSAPKWNGEPTLAPSHVEALLLEPLVEAGHVFSVAVVDDGRAGLLAAENAFAR